MDDMQTLGALMLFTPFLIVALILFRELGFKITLGIATCALIVSVFLHTAIRLLLGVAT